ncbi:hypothetical protein BDW22DRAFT_1330657 [Trametopsis cervina]|nr:hypothetical protein BDW22DRAFT_1330657 [Trametopsis cervina]
MRICADLSRLPKSVQLKSVNFRRTTPGSVFPTGTAVGYRGLAPRIDSTHAASTLHRTQLQRLLPAVRKPAFSLRAVPKAALYTPETVWPQPPYAPAPTRNGVVNMSLVKMIGLKVHKSAVIRKKITGRLKLAIRLIVTRGAQTEQDEDGNFVLVLDDADAGNHWVLDADWTYAITPQLEAYRMPFPLLVRDLRNALREIVAKGRKLDDTWSKQQRKFEPQSKTSRSSSSSSSSSRSTSRIEKPVKNEEADFDFIDMNPFPEDNYETPIPRVEDIFEQLSMDAPWQQEPPEQVR